MTSPLRQKRKRSGIINSDLIAQWRFLCIFQLFQLTLKTLNREPHCPASQCFGIRFGFLKWQVWIFSKVTWRLFSLARNDWKLRNVWIPKFGMLLISKLHRSATPNRREYQPNNSKTITFGTTRTSRNVRVESHGLDVRTSKTICFPGQDKSYYRRS